MGKKLEYTPRSKVRNALRQLWLRSREHSKALKDAHYTCQECGAKKSVAKGKEVKVEVHHKSGVIEWEQLIDLMYEDLLCPPDKLEVLCEACHLKKKEIEVGGKQ